MYQVLALLAPLITTPYISRVLGAEAIGEYSYAYSIVYYYMLFAILGTATYAEREISFCRDDKEKRTKRFWDLLVLRIITSAISFSVYSLGVSAFFRNKIMVLRDTFVKISTILLIFTFVKREQDMYIYALIMSISPVVSALSLWPFVRKYVDKIDLRKIQPFKDFKNVMALFIPTLAISIYAMLDKTMIGLFTTTKVENGYYEQATKLSKTALTVVTSLGTVMIPRISYYFEKKQTDLIELYMLKSYRFAFLLGFPICFGLMGISSNLVPWFYGTGFEKVAVLLKVSSFLVIAIGLSNITGLQYLVPTKQQDKLTKSVCLGAFVNVVLNMFLIPRFYSVGAAIASVLAEFSVTIIQFIYVKDQLNMKNIVKMIPGYFFSSIIMLVILEIETFVLPQTALATIFMIISGGAIYFLTLFIIKDSFVFEIIGLIKKKIR